MITDCQPVVLKMGSASYLQFIKLPQVPSVFWQGHISIFFFFLLVFINILWNPDIAPGASSKGVGIFSCIIYLRECLGCFLVLMSKGRFTGFQVLSGHYQSGSQSENVTSPWSRWWHLKIGKGGVVRVYCCSEERGCRAHTQDPPLGCGQDKPSSWLRRVISDIGKTSGLADSYCFQAWHRITWPRTDSSRGKTRRPPICTN